MKKIFKKILILLLALFVFTININKKEINTINKNNVLGEVLLGGDTIGLNISTKVTVIGKYKIETKENTYKPWNNTNIQEGDFIYKLNDKEIKKSTDISSYLSEINDDSVDITIIRKNKTITSKIDVVKNINEKNTIGLYIKDRIVGLGTLTFINPKTKIYASLGHSVDDALNDGFITTSKIKGIKKGVRGIPGEKFASILKEKIGEIKLNSQIGVFGKYNSSLDDKSTINIVSSNEVKVGKAQILTVITGNLIEYFDIYITEVNRQSVENIKGIKFTVTDRKLLDKTGGIIQGMSGSPIIQNDSLVGAVSHVIVNNPSSGYGVFSEWMYYKTL